MQQWVGDVGSEGSGGGDVVVGDGTSGATPMDMVGRGNGAVHTVPPKQPIATHNRAMNRRLQMMEEFEPGGTTIPSARVVRRAANPIRSRATAVAAGGKLIRVRTAEREEEGVFNSVVEGIAGAAAAIDDVKDGGTNKTRVVRETKSSQTQTQT